MLPNSDPFLTPKETVPYLREEGFRSITLASLATMRNRGGGPIYGKRGRFVVYRQSDLDKWIAKQSRGPFNSTSDGGPKPHRDADDDDVDLGL